MEDFSKFIARFRSEKGQGYTHTSIGNPRISLNIKDDQLPAFFTAYKRAMVARSVPLHLTEKPTNPSAMRADLDFRFVLPMEATERKRVYTQENVYRIAKAYFSILYEYLDAPLENFIAYVMEKSGPTEYRGKMKDGIHIVWPHLVTTPQVQHWVRKKILDNAKKIFTGLPLVNLYDDVVDVAIIDRNAWQMYGSTKPDCEPYRVTRILMFEPPNENEVVDPNDEDGPGSVIDITPQQFAAEDELNFVELFSMRNKNVATTIRESKQTEIEEYIRCVLPTMDDRRKTKLHQQIFGKSINHTKNYTSDEELHLARQLVVDCLSAHRAESYEDWIKLGWTLRNIDYRLIDAWVEFSKLSSKYISGQCEKLWDTMRIDTLGMGTLRWWARLDHEQRYNDILESNVINLIDKCTNDQAHYDVARVVYALFKDEYRFTSNDTWYVFMKQKHRWVRTREGLKLRVELSNRVCCEYMKRANYWSAQANLAQGDQNKDLCMKRHQQLMAIAWALKKSGYKDSVMKECKCLFADEKFEEILDSHPHLLGFENGVYDLRMHEFRGGSPDDYISFCTGRYYHPFDPEALESKELDTYFKQVFTNPNVCRYFKDLLILLIDGGIRQEKFYVFTGNGCHAAGARISMFDGTTKRIEDVHIGDSVMGANAEARVVTKLWRGMSKMLSVTGSTFEALTVTPNHKLAVVAHTGPTIVETMRMDAAELSLLAWYEIVEDTEEDGAVIRFQYQWMSTSEAVVFQQHLKQGANVVKESMVLQVQAELLKNHEDDFRMYSMCGGAKHAFQIKDMGDAKEPYYGIEVDGDHLYVMQDGLVTANSNSKSKILELVQKAVGDYYCILPIALLTQKRAASNSAQSELERTKGRRVAVMQEPGESEKLNIGLMKELSGGDIIMARGLFKEPIEFRPQFKMIMTCNELPEVPGDDGGTWRRIRVIEFTSKFCENPDPRKANEFPIDPELADKFERWSDTFISMLIDHHKKTDPRTIREPMEVRIATESYKKNNDSIGQFVDDRIERVDNATCRIQLNTLYQEFKAWAHHNIAKGKRVPEKSQIKAYFEKEYGAYPSGAHPGWRRLRFKTEEEADSDAEAAE